MVIVCVKQFNDKRKLNSLNKHNYKHKNDQMSTSSNYRKVPLMLLRISHNVCIL